MQLVAGLCHADTEPGIISKLSVFCHDLAVSVRAVDAWCKCCGVIAVMVDKQIGILLGTGRCQLRQWCLFHTPEGMIIGKQQKGKHLHAPVRRTGGIVPLRHGQIRISIADGQHMISVEDRTLQPGAQMPCDQTFHHGNRERLQSCQQADTEKAYLRETIGQGSAERNGLALFIEPVNELLCEFHGSRLVFFCPLRVIFLHNHGVDQTVKMNGKGNIIIFLSGISVLIPAFTQIEGLQSVQIFLKHLGTVTASHLFHGNVHQYCKEDPVAHRQRMLIDLI